MQDKKNNQQTQDHQIQRQVNPIRRPEYSDGAFVISGKKRTSHCHAEKRQQPECAAHD